MTQAQEAARLVAIEEQLRPLNRAERAKARALLRGKGGECWRLKKQRKASR